MKLLYQVQFIWLLLFNECLAYFYPPIFWHKDNCAFRKLQESKDVNGTKEYFIQVVPNNGMNVVCPNQVTVNNWLKDEGILSPTLFENMWLVDKQSYDQCTVGDTNTKYNRQILVCDQPKKIKYISLLFHPRFNIEEPRFAPGQHYYFISTSQGYKEELKTRKVSGTYGSCKRYHMKLHIYVCDPKKEDCVWSMPHCNPPAELHREMLMIDGKLPAPTHPPVVTKPPMRRKSTKSILPDESTTLPFQEKKPHIKAVVQEMCTKKEKGVSIHLILNFVLGGVAFFMLVVIVILACGLTKKSKEYKPARPPSTSSVHEPNKYAYVETFRYNDLQHGPSQTMPPYANYLILQKGNTDHTILQRTPQSYDGRVFTFPDLPPRDRRPTDAEMTPSTAEVPDNV